MPPTHHFEHLPLVLREHGPARFPRAPRPEDEATVANRSNRAGHTKTLGTHAATISATWQRRQHQRVEKGLPAITAGIPLLLKIDTSLDLDDLRRQFEFEIVSEQEDGFVIVVSEDVDLTDFQQRLAEFVVNIEGSANVAKIHQLREDLTQDERLNLILTEILLREWPSIEDHATYVCDVSIACVGTWEVKKKPSRNPRWKAETWARKENEWSTQRLDAYEKWDGLKEQRLHAVEEIIKHYRGEVLLNVDNQDVAAPTLPDSFTLRLKLPGKGLKDLVLNYPYIFEVAEPDDIELPQRIAREVREVRARLQIEAPDPNAPAVCVIDSGIQEEHPWLEPAIDKETSHCFLPNASATDVADYVHPSGHGTRVAGAVLYGEHVATSGAVSLGTWIQNARVLDANCNLPQEMFPPAVLREVVKRFHEGKRETRIFQPLDQRGCPLSDTTHVRVGC